MHPVKWLAFVVIISQLQLLQAVSTGKVLQFQLSINGQQKIYKLSFQDAFEMIRFFQGKAQTAGYILPLYQQLAFRLSQIINERTAEACVQCYSVSLLCNFFSKSLSSVFFQYDLGLMSRCIVLNSERRIPYIKFGGCEII